MTDPESVRTYEPLDSGKLYTPAGLCSAMHIGRKIYNALLSAGMPHTVINRRYFFSGRLVIQWIESRSTSI